MTIFRTLCERILASCDKKLLTAEILHSCSVEEEFLKDLLQFLESENFEVDTAAHGVLIARAAEMQSTTLLSYYFSKGWDCNAAPTQYDVGDRRLYGHSPPLPRAIEAGQTEVINLLLDHGADPNLPSQYAGSALLAAVKTKNVDLVKRLLSIGAEIDSEIHLMQSCSKLVHYAASQADLESLGILLDHGADITAQCGECPNTLMAAVKGENVPAIRFLVGRGLDVNQGDWYGRTPLFSASTSFLDSSAKTLLELGAQMRLPQVEVNSQIENTVRRLCHIFLEVLKMQEESFGQRPYDWRYIQNWVLLGRGLLLGDDELNGIIALEQCGYQDIVQPYFYSWKPCQLCGSVCKRNISHFCKEGEGQGVCTECTGKHWASLGEAANGHEFVQYPRPFLLEADVPAGCVALAEGKYISRVEWLENIIATWHAKPVADAQSAIAVRSVGGS